jgi:CBS domain-containing protein
MAAMMGGTMRAPLTAMMFGLELTHDINAMLPLVIGCATAHTTTVLLLKRSILTEKIARRGHHIVREYVVDPFETMRVADIMASPAETLPASWTVRDVVTFFTAPDAPRRHKSYPVTDRGGNVVGMVSRADALRWMLGEVAPERTLSQQLAGQELMTAYGDEPVGHLADRMSATDTGRVPILERSSGRLVGLVARRDLLRVRAHAIRHEREREALIRVLPRRGAGGAT